MFCLATTQCIKHGNLDFEGGRSVSRVGISRPKCASDGVWGHRWSSDSHQEHRILFREMSTLGFLT